MATKKQTGPPVPIPVSPGVVSSTFSSAVKLMTFNVGGNHSAVDVLHPELVKEKLAILCLNETRNLPNLDRYRLSGVRLSEVDAPHMQGLCLFMSEALRSHATLTVGKYSLSVVVSLPAVGRVERSVFSVLATYRSPNLSDEQNVEYFEELASTRRRNRVARDQALHHPVLLQPALQPYKT